MAYIPNNEDEKSGFLNASQTLENLKLLTEAGKENSGQTTSMLAIMDDLIRAMQQLQKMMVTQISPNIIQDNKLEQLKAETNKDKVPQSQAAVLLQQVQKAMEATVAQLSTSGRMLKQDAEGDELTNENFKATNENLSVSEKWRLYTELVQKKDESTTSYCHTKMRLGQDLGLSFRETRREMLIGLWSNRLCTILYLKNHNTEEDIMNDIEEWEKIERARSEVYKKYRNKNYKYL